MKSNYYSARIWFCISVAYSSIIVIGAYECSPIYGPWNEICSFLPAPPGHAPKCARPGSTFCEKIDRYPMGLIKYLIAKWGYDYNTLFTDETKEDFNSYYPPSNHPTNRWNSQPAPIYGAPQQAKYPATFDVYGPTKYTPINGNGLQGYQPSVGKPLQTYPVNGGDTYLPSSSGVRQTYQNYTTLPLNGYYRKPYYNPTASFSNQNGLQPGGLLTPGYINQQPQYNSLVYSASGVTQQFTPEEWWARYSRDNTRFVNQRINPRSKRSSPSVSKPKNTSKVGTKMETFKAIITNKRRINRKQTTVDDSVMSLKNKTSRVKRQSGSGLGQQLCASASNFVMPRAALNNQGNWMYVVNMPEVDNRYTQLVKSEICVSQQCDGLCQLPLGYTSRCEQKYVQKRLVALDGSGQQLRHDVFWFPSCCICTINSN